MHHCISNSGSRAVRAQAAWSQIVSDLKVAGIRSVDARRARDLVAREEWVVVDVRPMKDKKCVLPGAIEVPIFDRYPPATWRTWAKALACKLNGVEYFEVNSSFEEDVAALAAGRSVIVACDTGGHERKPSRSLRAAWSLRSTKAVAHLQVPIADAAAEFPETRV